MPALRFTSRRGVPGPSGRISAPIKPWSRRPARSSSMPPTKGSALIVRDGGGKDVFVGASALTRAGISDLAEGQRVAVDMVEGSKGPEAVSLSAGLKGEPDRIHLPWRVMRSHRQEHADRSSANRGDRRPTGDVLPPGMV